MKFRKLYTTLLASALALGMVIPASASLAGTETDTEADIAISEEDLSEEDLAALLQMLSLIGENGERETFGAMSIIVPEGFEKVEVEDDDGLDEQFVNADMSVLINLNHIDEAEYAKAFGSDDFSIKNTEGALEFIFELAGGADSIVAARDVVISGVEAVYIIQNLEETYSDFVVFNYDGELYTLTVNSYGVDDDSVFLSIMDSMMLEGSEGTTSGFRSASELVLGNVTMTIPAGFIANDSDIDGEATYMSEDYTVMLAVNYDSTLNAETLEEEGMTILDIVEMSAAELGEDATIEVSALTVDGCDAAMMNVEEMGITAQICMIDTREGVFMINFADLFGSSELTFDDILGGITIAK